MVSVREIMTKKVQTINSRSKARKAAETMAGKNIGSLVVVEGSKPKGVVTERDILDRVLAAGKDPEATTVADIMSTSLVQIRPDASLREAAETMLNTKNRLLVMEGDELVGIVTATDIVKGIHKEGSSFDISKTITKRVLTVSPETSMDDVLRLMSGRRVGSIMVSQNGRPYGIFTERDFVKKVLVPRTELSRKVGDLATKKLITANAGLDGKEAARIMATNGIKRLPLLKGEDVAEIVTARDLAEAFVTSA
ncbi:MAG TPA: CBS domain-containing protein [Candidatus Bathyarchaeia archaeon]